MRRICKYKIYFQTKKIIPCCSKRLLKFKRSKWKLLKRSLLQHGFQRKFFLNCSLIESKENSWLKSEKFFYNDLALKRLFYQFYDSSSKIPSKKFFSKLSNFSVLNFLTNFLVKVEYRLDVLLFKLGYFSTIHEARFFILQNSVLINGFAVKQNRLLKKNDVIQLKFYNNKFNSLSKNITISFFVPFVEVDYYTSTIVITKNYDELTLEDLSLMFPASEGLDKFYNINLK